MADAIPSGRTVQERLKLCHNLMNLRGVIKDDGLKAQVMAKRRVLSIRRVLLGNGGASLTDELLSPKVAGLRLMAMLEAVKDKPAHEQVATALYADGIMRTLNTLHNSEGNVGITGTAPSFPLELKRAVSALLPSGASYGDDVKAADPVLFDCLERGSFGKALKDELAAAAADGAATDSAVLLLTPGMKKVVEDQKTLYAALKILRDTSGVTDDAILAANQSYDKFAEEVYNPVIRDYRDAYFAAQKRAKDGLTAVGVKLIATVADASPITPDAATKWAKAQEITPQAVARFRKIGYPVEQVRLDMAEFYRFTAGRVAVVRIHSNGSRRANATDIGTHGKVGTINLSGSFTKRVLWHELAHHMEADPVAKMAAGRFIRRRAVDDKLHTLRGLTGNNGYSSDEIAVKGEFFSPYVGKIYAGGMTEVFAMGVESFSDPETLAKRVAQDPQTLEFVAGFVKTPIDPLAQAYIALSEIVREIEDDATDATESSLADRLKALAATVSLIADTETAWMGRYDWMLDRLKMKQIGQFKDSNYYLMSGTVRNPSTNRKMKGLHIVRIDDGLHQTPIASADQTLALAMFAVYVKSGVMPPAYRMSDEAYIKGMTQ